MAEKTQSLVLKLADLRCNVACLLDTRLDEGSEDRLGNLWEGDSFFAHAGDSRSAGIAFLIGDGVTVENFYSNGDGRYAAIEVKLADRKLLICAIYAPATSPRDRAPFFQQILPDIVRRRKAAGNAELVLLGDFNCVDNPRLDRSTARVRPDRSVNDLGSLISKLDVADAFRFLNPDARDFTFCSANGYAARLDRAYLSPSLINCTINVDHPPNAHSDHSFLQVDLDFREVEFGTKSWNLSIRLLEDEAYLREVRLLWSSWQKSPLREKNPSQWWDKGKGKIKTMSLNFRNRTSKAERKHVLGLEKRLRNAINHGKSGLVRHLSAQLREIANAKTRMHFAFRSLQWKEEGERCTKFFLNQHKRKVGETVVKRIRTATGPITVQTPEIVDTFREFYSELYTEAPTDEDAQNEVLGLLDRILTDEQSQKCSEDFQLKDLRRAMRESSNGKSPGQDGIPMEFFKKFWDLMGPDLFLVFRHSYETGLLPESQRTAVIRCLPKKGDLADVRNWRPISLLNADYKIFAKCITNRLATFLPFVISPHQTANVKSRKIQHNLRLLRDFVFLADSRQMDAFILSIDQMKAFDRVSWSYLLATVEKQNFPPLILNWIRVLYTDISSCVKVNGFSSDTFKVTRGVRQGCPLSPVLYVVFSEALNKCILKDDEIWGPPELGGRPVLSQFADDTCVGAIGLQSIFAIFRSLALFERASGAKVNPDKSHGLWLGSNRGRADRPQNVQWTSDQIKVLGIPLGKEADPLTDFWSNLLETVERRAQMHKHRDLSLKGRVIVIKQLLMPLFIYPSFVVVCPQDIVKRIQSTFDSFLWRDGAHKVPKCILELPVRMGGISYPNVERIFKSIRLSWTREIFSGENNSPWHETASIVLSTYDDYRRLSKDIFKLPLHKNRITVSHLPRFYKAWLKDWVDLGGATNRPAPSGFDGLLGEPLFGNPFVVAPGARALDYPAWAKTQDTPIATVRDLAYGVAPGFMPAEAIAEEHNLEGVPLQKIETVVDSLSRQLRDTICNPNAETDELAEFFAFDEEKKRVRVGQVSTKKFYLMLKPPSLDRVMEDLASRKTPFYTKWFVEIGPTKWPNVFKGLYENHRDRKTADIIYLLVHRGIFTRKRLLSAGLDISDSCPRGCNTPETLEHFFFTCPASVNLWEFALRFLKRLNPSFNTPVKAFVIQGIEESGCFDNPSDDVRMAYVATVWKMRNAAMMAELDNHDGLATFRAKLLSMLRLRMSSNVKAGKSHTHTFSSIADYSAQGSELVFTL